VKKINEILNRERLMSFGDLLFTIFFMLGDRARLMSFGDLLFTIFFMLGAGIALGYAFWG